MILTLGRGSLAGHLHGSPLMYISCIIFCGYSRQTYLYRRLVLQDPFVTCTCRAAVQSIKECLVQRIPSQGYQPVFIRAVVSKTVERQLVNSVRLGKKNTSQHLQRNFWNIFEEEIVSVVKQHDSNKSRNGRFDLAEYGGDDQRIWRRKGSQIDENNNRKWKKDIGIAENVGDVEIKTRKSKKKTRGEGTKEKRV